MIHLCLLYPKDRTVQELVEIAVTNKKYKN